MEVTALYIYPIKSLAGIPLQSAAVTPEGLEYDRQWMLIDEANHFLTLRQYPTLYHLQPSITNNQLQISDMTNRQPPLSIPIDHAHATPISVHIWEDILSATPVSLVADEWFSTFLQKSVRLVRTLSTNDRLVSEKYRLQKETVRFSDSMPILITNQQSLAALENTVGHFLSMERFRPNIVVSGTTAWEEDNWETLHINLLDYRITKPCGRCTVVNLEPRTTNKDKEPLRTLSALRRVGNKIVFGQYAIPAKNGTISLGDTVHINRTNELTL